jgi:hypothetical protein
MAPKPSIQRYRQWYAILLRLYPTVYRDRFGEGMKQTFSDLLRERVNSQQNILGYALWVYLETSLGIIKEHKTLMTMPPLKNVLRILLVVGGLLLIPFLAMTFQVPVYDPGSGFGPGVNWTVSDFVIMGTLLFITGLGLDLVMRKAGKYKVAAVIGIVVLFLWIWAELAVGVFTNIGS